ncbi:MAG: hypothetical protein KDA89_09150 [Planctomycetaceae bacterium]|nr:hypothetical protein [Planctomycetaceae bacterium]
MALITQPASYGRAGAFIDDESHLCGLHPTAPMEADSSMESLGIGGRAAVAGGAGVAAIAGVGADDFPFHFCFLTLVLVRLQFFHAAGLAAAELPEDFSQQAVLTAG